MHFGYFCYGTGRARIILYRSKPMSAFLESNDPQGSRCTLDLGVVPMRTKTARILLSEPMWQGSDFSLQAQEDNSMIGECCGYFREGTMHFTLQTGIFADVRACKITERETIRALPCEDSAGLRPTEIALLTRKWSGDSMQAWAQDTEWWSDEGLKYMSSLGRRGVTGYSAKGKVVTDCCAALVAVLNGPFEGKAGWLVWGGDGGLAVSGGQGNITAGIWYPVEESLPKKVRDTILFMPESVRSETIKKSKQNAAAR